MSSSSSRSLASLSGSGSGSTSLSSSVAADVNESVEREDSSYGGAVINGPYRVGNADGETCSYHALEEGASCRQPRSCYDCLNTAVSGVSSGCVLAPSGFCEDMSNYDASLDYRRNLTASEESETGWYNYFPSTNATYCEPSDAACSLCDALVSDGSLSTWGSDNSDTSTELMRQFCVGTNGCVCVMACESSTWEASMPTDCDAAGSSSNASGTDSTSYSTMLIFYLILQVALVGLFMYRRGLCVRFFTGQEPSQAQMQRAWQWQWQRPPRTAQRQGAYNNVGAISSPSNHLRLSGWQAMQNSLIQREQKGREPRAPQYFASPHVASATGPNATQVGSPVTQATAAATATAASTPGPSTRDNRQTSGALGTPGTPVLGDGSPTTPLTLADAPNSDAASVAVRYDGRRSEPAATEPTASSMARRSVA